MYRTFFYVHSWQLFCHFKWKCLKDFVFKFKQCLHHYCTKHRFWNCSASFESPMLSTVTTKMLVGHDRPCRIWHQFYDKPSEQFEVAIKRKVQTLNRVQDCAVLTSDKCEFWQPVTSSGALVVRLQIFCKITWENKIEWTGRIILCFIGKNSCAPPYNYCNFHLFFFFLGGGGGQGSTVRVIDHVQHWICFAWDYSVEQDWMMNKRITLGFCGKTHSHMPILP